MGLLSKWKDIKWFNENDIQKNDKKANKIPSKGFHGESLGYNHIFKSNYISIIFNIDWLNTVT